MRKIHQPCPDCSSSDALQLNDNGSSFCHSCSAYTKPDSDNYSIEVPQNYEPTAKPSFTAIENMLTTRRYESIPNRGLTTATAKAYGILDTPEKTYFSYYGADSATIPIAAKVRLPDKQFSTVGEWKEVQLFG